VAGPRARRVLALVAALLFAVTACGPRPDNSRVRLTPPVESTTVGPGDVFTLEIIGEKELPTEYQIAADGTVDLPYVHRVPVEGLDPHGIADLVKRRLVEGKILRDPSVIVRVREYNSKSITMLGQVAKPGRLPFTAGLTLIQAVSMVGGFNSIANRDRLSLTRKTVKGLETVTLSVDAIIEGRSPDVPLQAGDQIYVPERVF